MPLLPLLPRIAAFLIAALAVPAMAQSPRIDAQAEAALASIRPHVRVAGRDYPAETLEALMERHKVPAVSIALVKDGRIAWARAYGLADPATGQAATPETLFQAASISKPVAATGALALVDRGVLSLDRPVNEQLTTWHIPDAAESEGEQVTLRHLLTHTGGLTVHGFPGYAAGAPLPELGQILDGAAPANTDPVRVSQRPGAAWRYSGGGYTVLQALMIDATGEPFAELMDRLVLRPAGMARSSFAQPLGAARAAEAAVAHRGDGTAVPGGHHAYPELAAAGLWTTPSDLARWAMALSASLEGREGALLRPETAAAMMTPGPGDWGLGFNVRGEGGELRVSHGGANEGYRTMLIAWPRRGEALVIMTSSDNGGAILGAAGLALGQALGWPDAAPRMITPLELSAEERAAVVGRYAGGDFAASIALQGGRMMVTPAEGQAFEIVPVEGGAWVSPDTGMRLEFVRDPETGRVSAVKAGGAIFSRTP